MSVRVLDAATLAAVRAAASGTNGQREAGVVTAVVNAFAAGNVTAEIKSSAGTLLATVTRGPWTADTTSAIKTMTAGAYVSTVFAAAGTPARVVFKAGATEVFECSASLTDGGGDLEFLGPIADGVPVSRGAMIFRAQPGLDSLGWNVIPTIPFVEGTPDSWDMGQYLIGDGTTSFQAGAGLPASITYDPATKLLSYDGSAGTATVDGNTMTVDASAPITSFELSSPDGGTLLPFTIGQTFVQGDVTGTVVADIPNFQASIKNRWPDGSARFAVLSGRASLAANNQATTITLRPIASVTYGAAVSLAALDAAIPAGGVVLALTGHGIALGSVDLKPLITAASAGIASPGRVRHWQSGPECSEWHFYSPVGADPHLAVWFHVRMYAGGEIEIVTIVENGWSWVASPVSKDYTATLTINGTVRFTGRMGTRLDNVPTRVSDTAFSVTGDKTSTFAVGRIVELVGAPSNIVGTITDSVYTTVTTVTVAWDGGAVTQAAPTAVKLLAGHRHHTRWSREDWYGSDPRITPKHDVAYLRSTKLVPNYGWSAPPETRWTDACDSPTNNRALIQTVNPDPFTEGNYRYRSPSGRSPMGETGVSSTIGWAPLWEALYVATGDARAYRCMIGNARLFGRFPVHYRDENDGMVPIRAAKPDYRLKGFSSTNPGIQYTTPPNLNADKFPTPVDTGARYPGQTWVSTHSPGAGYIAYLVTGRYSFMESVQFAAAVGLLSQAPGRRPASGSNYINQNTASDGVRKEAWDLRHIVQAFLCIPDGDAGKAHLGESLKQSYTWYAARAATSPYQNNLGVTFTDHDDDTAGASTVGLAMAQTFMENFACMSFGMAYLTGAYPTEVDNAAKNSLAALVTSAMRFPIGMLGDGVNTFGWRLAQRGVVECGIGDTFPPPGGWYASWKIAYDNQAARETSLGITSWGEYADQTEGQTMYNAGDFVSSETVRALLGNAALAVDLDASDLTLPGAADSWRRISTASNFLQAGTQSALSWMPNFAWRPR